MKLYSHIFQRVYCSPVAISAEGFRAVDAVLRPRLLGKVAMPDPEQLHNYRHELAAAPGRKNRPKPTFSQDGKSIVDHRLYGFIDGTGIATVPIKGVLARNVSPFEEACMDMTSYDAIAAALQQADAADEVTDIILDVDSPGGECTGCFETAGLIAGISKPVYGYTEGMATSAAALLLAQSDECFATVASTLGSCGVMCAVLDDTKALADEGLVVQYFTAGSGKLAYGGTGYSLTDADRASIQSRVDYLYGMFAASFASGRQRGASQIDPLAKRSAGLYIGQQGVSAGIVDGIVNGFSDLVDSILSARTV